MNASELLTTGRCGVRWTPPAGTVLRDAADELQLTDGDGLGWHAVLSPLPFALAPGEDDALAEDLEASARLSYDVHFLATPRLQVGVAPATADRTWSPLIESGVATSGGARCLRALRYQAVDPVHVIGHLIAPVAAGTVELRVAGKGDGAVARVRAALERTLGGLAITAAPERPRELVLDDAACAFVPPPRFVPFSRGAMAPNLRALYRGGLDGWKRLLDVWRLTANQIRDLDPRPALAKVADQIVEGWAREGVTHIQLDTRPVDAFGNRPQIEQYVRFRSNGNSTHTLHRWWMEPDGRVYRLGSNAPPTTSRKALAADLDLVQATFRTL